MTTPPGDPATPPHSHYFDPAPSVRTDPQTIHVSLPDLSFDMQTDAGVFGRRRLDPGTKILLREAPDLPSTGEFLDLGCGAGPIAITMALRRPASRVWAVDVNARARQLTADNCRDLGLTNVVVADPDSLPAEVRFDVIWSNPPIKVGKKILHDMLVRWLHRLSPGGRAILVVHKNLGSDSLARWVESQGLTAVRLGSHQGYRLLDIRPDPST